jgi:hypothetical protein
MTKPLTLNTIVNAFCPTPSIPRHSVPSAPTPGFRGESPGDASPEAPTRKPDGERVRHFLDSQPPAEKEQAVGARGGALDPQWMSAGVLGHLAQVERVGGRGALQLVRLSLTVGSEHADDVRRVRASARRLLGALDPATGEGAVLALDWGRGAGWHVYAVALLGAGREDELVSDWRALTGGAPEGQRGRRVTGQAHPWDARNRVLGANLRRVLAYLSKPLPTDAPPLRGPRGAAGGIFARVLARGAAADRRVCEWCGRSLAGKRPQARTCGASCRSLRCRSWARMRAAKRSTDADSLTRQHALMTRVGASIGMLLARALRRGPGCAECLFHPLARQRLDATLHDVAQLLAELVGDGVAEIVHVDRHGRAVVGPCTDLPCARHPGGFVTLRPRRGGHGLH